MKESVALYSELSQVSEEIVDSFLNGANNLSEDEIVDELFMLKSAIDTLGADQVKKVIVQLNSERNHGQIIPFLNRLIYDNNATHQKDDVKKKGLSEHSSLNFIKTEKRSVDNISQVNKPVDSNRDNKLHTGKKSFNFIKNLFSRKSNTSKDKVNHEQEDNCKLKNREKLSENESRELNIMENNKSQFERTERRGGEFTESKLAKPLLTTSSSSSPSSLQSYKFNYNKYSSEKYMPTNIITTNCNENNAINMQYSNTKQINNPTTFSPSVQQSVVGNVCIPKDGEITANVKHEEQLLAKEYNFCNSNSGETFADNREDGQFYAIFNQFLRTQEEEKISTLK